MAPVGGPAVWLGRRSPWCLSTVAARLPLPAGGLESRRARMRQLWETHAPRCRGPVFAVRKCRGNGNTVRRWLPQCSTGAQQRVPARCGSRTQSKPAPAGTTQARLRTLQSLLLILWHLNCTMSALSGKHLWQIAQYYIKQCYRYTRNVEFRKIPEVKRLVHSESGVVARDCTTTITSGRVRPALCGVLPQHIASNTR